MRRCLSATLLLLFLPGLIAAQDQSAPPNGGLRFKIQLAPTLSAEPVAGRLLVFMTKSAEPVEVVKPSFFELEKVWVAAKEIRNLAPGGTVEINGDMLAYPGAFSTAPAGD